MAAHTYTRVTYRPEGGRARTVYLQDLTTAGDIITGVEVDREGAEVYGRGFDERRHVISAELVTRREPVVMDLTYGELVPAPEETA